MWYQTGRKSQFQTTAHSRRIFWKRHKRQKKGWDVDWFSCELWIILSIRCNWFYKCLIGLCSKDGNFIKTLWFVTERAGETKAERDAEEKQRQARQPEEESRVHCQGCWEKSCSLWEEGRMSCKSIDINNIDDNSIDDNNNVILISHIHVTSNLSYYWSWDGSYWYNVIVQYDIDLISTINCYCLITNPLLLMIITHNWSRTQS